MRRDLTVPHEIRALLDLGAKLVISVSGGKDSHAMLSVLRRTLPEADTRLLFANLGQAEWPQTPGIVRSFSQRYGVPLEVVQKRKAGKPEDFVDFYEAKMDRYAREKPGTPFWMSAKYRDCTAAFKRGPANAFFAHFDLLINTEGIRAEESRSRAKRPTLSVRACSANEFRHLSVSEAIHAWKQASPTHRSAPRAHPNPATVPPRCSGRHKPLLVVDWHPIHPWSERDVWEEIGHPLDELEERRRLYAQGHHDEALAGWTTHPCYVFGAKRCSCVLCVMGDKRTLRVGMRENPELAERYKRMERESGYTLQPGRSLDHLDATRVEQGRLL